MPTVPYVPKEVIQKVLQGNVLDRVRRLDEDHLIPRRFGGSPYCPPWALPCKNLITNGFTLPEISRTRTRPLNLLPHLTPHVVLAPSSPRVVTKKAKKKVPAVKTKQYKKKLWTLREDVPTKCRGEESVRGMAQRWNFAALREDVTRSQKGRSVYEAWR